MVSDNNMQRGYTLRNIVEILMNRDLWIVFIILLISGTALTAQALPPGPPGPPASMTLEASPAAAAADGIAYSTIIATLIDAYGQPSPGVNTFFTSTLGDITTQYGYFDGFGYLNISDAQGKAYAKITSGSVGNAVVTATTANGISKQVTVTFITPLPKYNISGYKINDINGNGVWNTGEAGIPGWNITLKNATTGAVIASTSTDSQGLYQFNNVEQGNYNITEEDRAGWIHTNASFTVINLNSDVVNQNFTNQYDLIPPVITGAPTTEPNSNGWYNTNVTVRFECQDAGSGVVDSFFDVFITLEGENQEAEGKCTDKAGNTASTSVDGINIDKTPPAISINTLASYGQYTAGTVLNFSASDAMSGLEGSAIGQLTDNDGITSSVSSGFVPSPGVYTFVIEATDKAGNTACSEQRFFVVYDPAGGFATGGGWLIPDSESTLPDGRANFGFVVKYKNRVSTGNLEFQYKDADINLKSTSIDWLTITGVSAIFQGTATINGEGQYTFRVTAKDNAEPGANTDSFDISIWQGTGTDTEPIHRAKKVISGGNIEVHRK